MSCIKRWIGIVVEHIYIIYNYSDLFLHQNFTECAISNNQWLKIKNQFSGNKIIILITPMKLTPFNI